MSISTLKTEIKKRIRIMMFKLKVKAILSDASKALNAADCGWFCDFGTLLGIVRNGKILAWDYEVDIGILDADHEMLIRISREMAKISAEKIGEKAFHGMVINQKYKLHGINIDLHYYYAMGNGCCCYLTVANEDKNRYGDKPRLVARLTYNHIDLYREVDVIGVPLRIPMNAEELLAQKYGEDWRIPNSNWKTIMSPTITIFENETIESC